MDIRRFVAYLALAVWLAFTAVLVNSANEWRSSKMRISELTGKLDSIAKEIDWVKKNDVESIQILNRAQKDIASTQTALLDGIDHERIRRTNFEAEGSWWLGLSVLTAALWASKKRI